MAHFAKLSEDNIVLDVIVVNDAWLDDNGTESEAVGIAALQLWSGWPYWAQTSYSNAKRVRYGGIGFTFDRALNAFIPPKPYASWILNEDSCLWEAPVEYPIDGEQYNWNEETQTWDLITQ